VSLDFERSATSVVDVPRPAADRRSFARETDPSTTGRDGAGLRGTVVARDGRRVTGSIRWDNDEQYAWELLDGRIDGVELAIEMGHVRSVERVVGEGLAGEEAETESRVTLSDGRVLTLGDDRDVSEGNRGVFVDPGDGETHFVAWHDFVRADFEP
jgi:hypothetical protein